MEIKKIILKLHPLERKVLPFLDKESDFSQIVKKSGLKEVEVRRALQWLENKKILKVIKKRKKIITLGKEGRKYLREGLPEKRFLKVLNEEFLDLKEVIEKTKLTKEEVNACLGQLKRKQAIKLKKEKVALTPSGKKLLEEGFPEENFLKKKFPLTADTLEEVEKKILDVLRKRKGFLRLEEKKEISLELSPLGREILKADWGEEGLGQLTPEILKKEKWKEKEFRQYDIETKVPRIYRGKKHFVNEALEYARQIWLEMGFKEMTGELVVTSFWNFDALFTAQDHPVRELQDTFYLEGKVKKGKLPEEALVRKVKEMHETGGTTKSKGWKYKWDPEEAKKNVLRTHTTILSAKTLARLREKDLPAKFFALGKCFRNETLDWSHLFEFNQTEGIVVDEKANFRHLLGYLKEFFKKMGFPQARFRPAFFPYTSPSVEIEVFHPLHKKWVELGGAGIFRPEVVVPLLGKEIPVLAWGPGFDRIILDYYQIKDIRELYKNNLKQLREIKVWLR